MGRVNLSEGANQMFSDIYRIAQQFWVMEDNENYWDRLYQAINWFMDRHKDEPYAWKLVMSFVEWKEDELRALKGVKDFEHHN